MNAKKGKGKPRPSKPNPNPPQKEEQVAGEKVENVSEEFESAQKSEERVPEIISEVVIPPVVESKDKEDDGPKKPKRNRGKKKKHDKDESEPQDQPGEIVEDVQLEIIEIETPDTVEENVTPSARKKKNKNKKTADSDTKSQEKPDKELTLEDKKTDETGKTETEMVANEDSKPKKKNKKKKQRNDSERSDVKVEEISCTSAFEKLLKDEKSDDKLSENEPIFTEITSPDIPKSEEMNISAFIQELEKVENVDYTSQENKNPGKNKKKNKKDKKETPKEIESEMMSEISLMTAIKPISKDEFTKDSQKSKDILPPTDEVIPVDIAKIEEDTKPKAKIAKPVERKRKGKGDKYVEELPTEAIIILEESANKEVIAPSPIIDIESSKDIPQQTEILTETQKEKETAPVPTTSDAKQSVSKTSEKKKKGKSKHSEDLMPEIGQTKSEAKDEVAPILPQEIMEIRTDTNKDEKFVAPETTEVVKEKENVQETEKFEPKVEKKKKEKKNAKHQDPILTSKTEVQESKPKELITPIQQTEDTVRLSDIIKEDKIENIGPITEIKIDNKVISEAEKAAKTDEKDSHSLEILKNISQDKVFEDDEEIIMEPITDIAVEFINVPIKCEILEDMPFMPDPIENIQSKQEILSDIELRPDESKDISFISPQESGMGKKRKKSPKPPKHDKKVEMVELKLEEMPEIFKKEEIISPPKEELKMEKIIATPIVSPKQDIKQDEPKPMEVIESMLTTDILQKTEDKTPFETKTKKKRKKSPKLPREPVTQTTEPAVAKEAMQEKDKAENMAASTDSSKEKAKGTHASQEKGEITYDLPSDVEIRSLKADESEDSTCGFTPDIIQYPRATSQDLIDDNNNMLIQEITLAEEVKLQIPLQIPDTPLIQGSGATPLEAPESILAGIRISHEDVDASKSESEKTDLKSKMMEVNQDMEELRLSIEKSLAELTAIEKSEGEVQKKFEERKNKAEEPFELKISMPSEIVAKTQCEKVLKTPETRSKKVEPPLDKQEPGKAAKTESSISTTPSDDKPVETNIPPKTMMFFDKELKDTDVPLKADIIQQEPLPVMDIPKITENISDVTLPPALFADIPKVSENTTDTITPPIPPARKDNKSSSKERESKDVKMKAAEIKPIETVPSIETSKPPEIISDTVAPPVCPARKDNKSKGKNKKKGKQEAVQAVAPTESTSTTESNDPPKETKKEEKTAQKTQTAQEKGKQQSEADGQNKDKESSNVVPEFEPIENFEDAMTSSADDINKSFEMIANEANRSIEASHVNPEIKIVAPVEDTQKGKKEKRNEKTNPVSQPKNLLGHPDIPVRLNKTDYKKEKNKTPNAVLAKVKIKDSVEIEANKQSKDTQTDNIKKFLKSKSIDESFCSVTNENDEFVYKYSFRKVFLQSACHVCKKELKQARVPCNFCNLVFYCNAKHKDEDWPQHQGLCFAISTIVHLKDQKHIYADAQNVTGQDYRLLRMQMIVSCERVLKRKLAAWEQEALLYPRVCADASCREWRQSKLQDCDGCGQISYCSANPSHFTKSHQRWCKSYALYQKLVCHQQTRGRLEPKLPSKVMVEHYRIPEKINEALATMYEEKIDMNDIQYAALTQIATAPLTTAYCHQTFASTSQANGTYKKTSCTVHMVGGELQFEADALNKWEVFFLHLRPQLQELRVVMVGADLNPSNLPLELLGKVKLCETCRFNKRRVVFSFQDKTTYHDYRASDEFVTPDIVCAFNPSIKRSSMYNGKDPWPKTISCVVKQKVPFLVTAYTMNELQRDLARVRECSEVDVKVVIEPKLNSFASVRPDRNFISDDEMPLLFKNYCCALLCGAN